MRYPHPISVEARCLQSLTAGPSTANDLARTTGATGPGTYGALHRLLSAGKVRREFNGRAASYSLTGYGRKAAERERKLILATCGVAA